MRDDQLPDDLAAMFAVERAIPPAPPDAIERVRARLGASVARSAPMAGTRLVASKHLVVVGMVAVLAGTRLLAHVATGGSQPTPPRATSIASSPAPLPAPRAPEPTRPLAVSDPPAPSPAHRPASIAAAPALPVPARAASRPSVSERELLERAVACLARRDAHCALTAVRAHAQLYAGGKLAEDREALWIEALVLAGDTAGARARTRAFLQAYPHSLYTAAVQRTLLPP